MSAKNTQNDEGRENTQEEGWKEGGIFKKMTR